LALPAHRDNPPSASVSPTTRVATRFWIAGARIDPVNG
jgi:hypothetical protein